MAGNIQNVNLTKLKSEVDDYTALAKKLSAEVMQVSDNLVKLKSFWTGKRVNTVINLWNQNGAKLIDNVNYFSNTIRAILNEIYEQYVRMEAGKPENISTPMTSSVSTIPLTDANTIKFDQANVTKIVNSITTNNQNVSSYLKTLVNKLDGMQAYSDSLKSLATNYKTAANSIQGSISNIINEINTESNKALNDVKLTEGYNEADAARAKS